MRYRSLDPIRSALLAGLAEHERDAALVDSSAALQEIVDGIWPDHTQPIVLGALDAVADEHDNLRFLLADRMLHAPDVALELAIGASDYWVVRGHVMEGRAWLSDAIEAARPAGPARWRAALALVRATRTMPETAQLRELLESVTAEAREDGSYPVIHGGLLLYLAIARAWQGDRGQAAQALDEATRLDRVIGSEWTRAHLEHLRALDAVLTGNFAAARKGQLVFVARMLDLGDPAGAATGRYLAASIGDMMGSEAELADVRADLASARELAEQVGDMSLLSRVLLLEARVLQKSNDASGRAVLLDAVDRLTEQGGIGAAALARRDIGLLALRDGASDEAEAHLRVVAPLLLRLDRSASAPAWAGLAHVAAPTRRRHRRDACPRRPMSLPNRRAAPRRGPAVGGRAARAARPAARSRRGHRRRAPRGRGRMMVITLTRLFATRAWPPHDDRTRRSAASVAHVRRE